MGGFRLAFNKNTQEKNKRIYKPDLLHLYDCACMCVSDINT